jgi:hypothetical protein
MTSSYRIVTRPDGVRSGSQPHGEVSLAASSSGQHSKCFSFIPQNRLHSCVCLDVRSCLASMRSPLMVSWQDDSEECRRAVFSHIQHAQPVISRRLLRLVEPHFFNFCFSSLAPSYQWPSSMNSRTISSRTVSVDSYDGASSHDSKWYFYLVLLHSSVKGEDVIICTSLVLQES